jgi:2,5-diamino-6-(ribosylamino)-4(3H)-pyrimidinone 5'-phosphate reductase
MRRFRPTRSASSAPRKDTLLSVGRLSEKYSVGKILVDTGSALGNIPLNNGLIDEISLIISPEIIGKHARSLFEKIETKINLRCTNCELLEEGYIWITYDVDKKR